MLRTLVRRAHVHKPGFRFPDRKAPKGNLFPRILPLSSTRSLYSLLYLSLSLATETHKPHPHPAAPSSIVSSFDHFQKVFASGPHFHPEKLSSPQSSSSSESGSSGSGLLGDVDMNDREVAEDIHLLPERFWRTPALTFSEAEMDAIMVSIFDSQCRDGNCTDHDALPFVSSIHRLEEQTEVRHISHLLTPNFTRNAYHHTTHVRCAA